MKQEVNSTDVWHFEPLDEFAIVFLAEQLLDLRNGEEGSQPIPLIVVSNKEAHIGVTGLVPRSTKYSPPYIDISIDSRVMRQVSHTPNGPRMVGPKELNGTGSFVS